MKHILPYLTAVLLLSAGAAAHAQEQVSTNVSANKTVHNFGDVLISDGPQSCSFTLKNTGKKPLVIYNAVTSCGCTDVEWTKSPIKPGEKGEVKVTYNNDEGPYPFDKSITVYHSDSNKPLVLRLRGVSRQKQLPLMELYPVRFGALGFKSLDVKAGNMEQGRQKSDVMNVANLSDKPVTLSFDNVSPQLELKVSKNPIPAGEVAELQFTVTADRELWGKNYYYFTPVAGGRKTSATGYSSANLSPGGKGVVGIWAITKENFSSLTKDEKLMGPRPMLANSNASFGKVKAGKLFDASFEIKNEGKKELRFYKADSDFAGAVVVGDLPVIQPGQKGTVKVHLDTSAMPAGEALVIISLITNSPTRPLVDVFLTGWIE